MNEVLGRKREHGPACDGSVCPADIVQRCLIRCSEFDQVKHAVERQPGRCELQGAQALDCTVEICARLRGWLGWNAPHFLELPHRAVRCAAPRKHIHELQAHGKIRRRNGKHGPQAILIPPQGCTIGLPCIELGKRVQHVRIASGVATQPLERGTRVRRAPRQRIELCEYEADFRARGVELAGTQELCFGIGEAAGLQVCETKVRVASRIIRGELRELLELRLRLGQLIALEKAAAQRARGVQLFHRRRLGPARHGCPQRGGGEEECPCSPGHSGHVLPHRAEASNALTVTDFTYATNREFCAALPATFSAEL